MCHDKECFDITSVKYCFADNTAFESREREKKNVAVNMSAVRSVIDINIITQFDIGSSFWAIESEKITLSWDDCCTDCTDKINFSGMLRYTHTYTHTHKLETMNRDMCTHTLNRCIKTRINRVTIEEYTYTHHTDLSLRRRLRPRAFWEICLLWTNYTIDYNQVLMSKLNWFISTSKFTSLVKKKCS